MYSVASTTDGGPTKRQKIIDNRRRNVLFLAGLTHATNVFQCLLLPFNYPQRYIETLPAVADVTLLSSSLSLSLSLSFSTLCLIDKAVLVAPQIRIEKGT